MPVVHRPDGVWIRSDSYRKQSTREGRIDRYAVNKESHALKPQIGIPLYVNLPAESVGRIVGEILTCERVCVSRKGHRQRISRNDVCAAACMHVARSAGISVVNF